jgi:hypothetical protein
MRGVAQAEIVRRKVTGTDLAAPLAGFDRPQRFPAVICAKIFRSATRIGNPRGKTIICDAKQQFAAPNKNPPRQLSFRDRNRRLATPKEDSRRDTVIRGANQRSAARNNNPRRNMTICVATWQIAPQFPDSHRKITVPAPPPSIAATRKPQSGENSYVPTTRSVT